MKKKLLKFLMLAIMLVGLIISISNFSSSNLKAASELKGVYASCPDGSYRCVDSGNDCTIKY